MKPGPVSKGKRGFTLIEVIGALVVFSVGVLMVLRLTGAMATQINSASLRSQLSVAVQTRLDSLRTVPYDSLTVGSVADTIMLQNRSFDRTQTTLQASALVREVEVSIQASDGGGPNLTSSSFVLRSW